ncbi:hypothetical protein BDF20DRAFT_891033 [Mycotypha africana]|uniref:uncharacterized protein n=1 Tax=Mycotypha africana TaxID=64632 RepID=UPI002300E6E4|nr:uncharacterized protein BDF20DRAFT_891033 [Mycotypha africana]KAI8970399.1 hypothetical protein BDF20DRAFT_891033 [Mycotypha africana]
MSRTDEAKAKVSNMTDEMESKVKQGATAASNKVDELLENENVDRAARRTEEEAHKLKDDVRELKRKAGPKIQEAENFLTSPAAINFYKGLITGVALVFAYNRYTESRYRF